VCKAPIPGIRATSRRPETCVQSTVVEPVGLSGCPARDRMRESVIDAVSIVDARPASEAP